MRQIVFFIIVFFCYCSPAIKTLNNYYYVEPFKEQEIKLFIKSDFTFSFKDLTGCNQFEITGRYRKVNDTIMSYLILDSVKRQLLLSNGDSSIIFPVNDGDTAWIINKERVFIHHQPFIATRKSNIDLQEIRYQKLKEHFIGLFGREEFIKTFGNGKSIRGAKEKLLDCSLPDLKLKIPN